MQTSPKHRWLDRGRPGAGLALLLLGSQAGPREPDHPSCPASRQPGLGRGAQVAGQDLPLPASPSHFRSPGFLPTSRPFPHIQAEEPLGDATGSFPEVETEQTPCWMGVSFHFSARRVGAGGMGPG